MKKHNLSFIEKCDAIVLFSLVGTGVVFFLMNSFADLFIWWGVKQIWLQRTIIVAPFVAAMAFFAWREKRSH